MGPRQRTMLQNADGTELTTEDYLKVTADMKKTGEPPMIANFGLNNTSIHELNKKEEQNKQVKQKDHISEVLNAKRLIAKYARAERIAWEQNLKEKGLWTQAQERRSKKLGNKTDYDLYQKLEAGFNNSLVEGNPHHATDFRRAGLNVSQSVENAQSLLN